MFSTNLTYFPRQKLHSSKKTDKWAQECIDVAEKMVLSGKKVTIVPLSLLLPIDFAGYNALPLSYSCSQILPSIYTVALKCSERAFPT